MNATTLMKTDELLNLEREVSEGNTTPAVKRRLERLKSRYEKDRLGLLAKVLVGHEFRDDVLYRATVRDSKFLPDCVGDPLWSTVEELNVLYLRSKSVDLAAFLATMPQLHTLTLDASQLPPGTWPGITRLEVSHEVAMHDVAERFPSLTALELSYVRNVVELWRHPFTDQLQSVTLGELTWSNGVLRFGPGHGGAHEDWIAQGPALHRMELREDQLSDDRMFDLQQLFAAARHKGAEVVLLPEPEPRSEWRSYHRRYDRWH